MKRILLLFLAWLLPAAAVTAQSGDGGTLRISLLTCSSGTDIASAYGHSAVRVTDLLSGADIVFNYGSYNFEEPHFVFKFMKGSLDYMLSVVPYDAFVRSYALENRSVCERVLNLTPEQTAAVYLFLVNNYQGKNRFYRYDYFSDNCATRIRDIITGPASQVGAVLPSGHTSKYSYRSAISDLCIGESGWLKFGLDILLGARIDRPLSMEEEMFLPCLLEENLSGAVDAASGNVLLSGSEELVPRRPAATSRMNRVLKVCTSPVAVFTVLCVAFCLLFLFFRRGDRVIVCFSRGWCLILGLAGVLVLFMWAGTDHYWTKDNWNLLWADPLFLVPAVIRRGKFREVCMCILSAVSSVPVLLWGVIPQVLNPAVLPIVVLSVLICCATVMCGTGRRDVLRPERVSKSSKKYRK